MEIDIRELETYQELAHDGAQSAAKSLSQLTGISTRVQVTDVSLMNSTDLEYEFIGDEFAGVNIDLSGEMSGEIVLAFDEQGRSAITDTLVPADDPEKKKQHRGVGNIMTSGFVDGWANYLEAKIKAHHRRTSRGPGPTFCRRPQPRTNATCSSSAVALRHPKTPSTNRSTSVSSSFRIRPPSSARSSPKPTRSSHSKLEVFNEMTKEGAKSCDEHYLDDRYRNDGQH